MPWLDQQHPAVANYWVRTTNIPMLSSGPEGEIYWTNHAFEQLTGYTTSEFTEGSRPLTWTDLTVDKTDLKHDLNMAEKVVLGEITDYSLIKEYKTKLGEGILVNIHVLRYPKQGDFEFFLVSVYSMEHADVKTVEEIQRLHAANMAMVHEQQKFNEQMEEFRKDLVRASPAYIWTWMEKHPKVSAGLATIAVLRVLGFSVPEIVTLIKEALT